MATTKYIGEDVVVEFGAVDVSGEYTDFEMTEDAPEPDQIDVSDKSSSVQELVEGLPKQPKSNVSLSANDKKDAASAIPGLTLNSQDTLIVYPEGKTHGKPMRTIQSVRLNNRSFSGGYQEKVAWKLGFYAYESVTDDTYSTV